jgi:hypothetical protein
MGMVACLARKFERDRRAGGRRCRLLVQRHETRGFPFIKNALFPLSSSPFPIAAPLMLRRRARNRAISRRIEPPAVVPRPRPLKRDMAPVTHHLGADLDQLLSQAGRRSAMFRLASRRKPELCGDAAPMPHTQPHLRLAHQLIICNLGERQQCALHVGQHRQEYHHAT